MPLTEVDVVREGSRAEVDGDGLPVADGDELRVKISEPHMYNTTDGVARLNGGYGVVIGGAIGYIGQDHRIRIDRASRTGAFATLLDAKTTAFELEPEPGVLLRAARVGARGRRAARAGAAHQAAQDAPDAGHEGQGRRQGRGRDR